MTQWAYVLAAYSITGIGLAGLLVWSWLSMRRAEAKLDGPAGR